MTVFSPLLTALLLAALLTKVTPTYYAVILQFSHTSASHKTVEKRTTITPTATIPAADIVAKALSPPG